MSRSSASSVESADSQALRVGHQRSQDMYACTIREDALRAVPARSALRRLGAVLRQSGGTADTYKLSRPTTRIDTFWSHSWRGCPRHKIATMYFVYNNKAAVMSSLLVCFAVGALVRHGAVEGKLCFKSGCVSSGDCDTHSCCKTGGHLDGIEWANGTYCAAAGFCCSEHAKSLDCPGKAAGTRVPFLFWPLCAAGCTYFAVLIMWQPADLVFLDKVCIHQTDPVRKRRGIDGLGGFLRNSEEIARIFWDPTYFTRLWCTFELAAFTYLHGPEARMRVFPIVRGYVIIVSIFGALAFEAAQALCDTFYMYRGVQSISLIGVFSIGFGTWFAHTFRLYAREHRDMQKQMDCFKCQSAECFCCSVGHVVPNTTATIECDREAIYGVVRMWFPGGLDEFDALVRDTLPAQVERSLGASLFRFRDSFYLALPSMWTAVSINASVGCGNGWASMGRLTLDMFSVWATTALQIATLIWMAGYAHHKRTHLDVGISVLIAIIWDLLRRGQLFVDQLNYVHRDTTIYNHGSQYWRCVFIFLVVSQAVIAKMLFAGASFRSRQAGDMSRSGKGPADSHCDRPAIEMPAR